MELKDKVAVVTGGGGILGGSFARTLAASGAKVAVLGRTLQPLEEVVAQIKAAGGIAIAVQADVVNKASLLAAQRTITDTLGTYTILVNAAGGNHPKGTTSMEHFTADSTNNPNQTSFFDLEQEGVSHVFDLNFLGTFLPTQVFAKDMVHKEGVVINISSVSADNALTKVPAYSAAKAAITNFTKWLAVHFAKSGIRVNAIAPGFFLTHQNRNLLLNEDGTLSKRGKKIIEQTPMQRFGQPEDLSSTLLWLCSPGSAFVTGIVVHVDGGFTAYSGV